MPRNVSYPYYICTLRAQTALQPGLLLPSACSYSSALCWGGKGYLFFYLISRQGIMQRFSQPFESLFFYFLIFKNIFILSLGKAFLSCMYVLQFGADSHNIIVYFQCKEVDGPKVLLLYLSNVLQGLLGPKLFGFCEFKFFI